MGWHTVIDFRDSIVIDGIRFTYHSRNGRKIRIEVNDPQKREITIEKRDAPDEEEE